MKQFALSKPDGWILEGLTWGSSLEEALLGAGDLYRRAVEGDNSFDPKTFDPYDVEGLHVNAEGKVGVLLLVVSRKTTMDMEEGILSATYNSSFIFVHQRERLDDSGQSGQAGDGAFERFKEGSPLFEQVRFTYDPRAKRSDFSPYKI